MLMFIFCRFKYFGKIRMIKCKSKKDLEYCLISYIYYMLKNILCTTIIALCLVACKSTGTCEGADKVELTAIKFLFKDSMTNRFMYTQVLSLYNKDSLKFFSSNGTRLNDVSSALNINPDSLFSNSRNIYEIQLNEIFDARTDSSSFTSEVCKNFIIQHRWNIRDTISVCFKSKLTDCASEHEYLRIFYKGKMLANVTNSIFCTVRLVR
jgi:hypothetical protein